MEIKIDNNYMNMSLVKSIVKSMSLSKIVNKLNKNPKARKEHINNMLEFISSLDPNVSIMDAKCWDYTVIIEAFNKFGSLNNDQYNKLINALFFNDYTLTRACDIAKAIMDSGCKWYAYRAQYGVDTLKSRRETSAESFKMLDKLKEVSIQNNILNEHNVKFFESDKGLYFLRVYCEMYGSSSWSLSCHRDYISDRSFISILCAYTGIDIYDSKMEKTYIHSIYDSYVFNTLTRLSVVDKELYDNHFKIEFEKYIYNILANYKIKRKNFYSVLSKVEIYIPKERKNIINNGKRIIIERALELSGKQIADIVLLNPEMAFIDGLIKNKLKRRSFKKEFVTKELE